MVSERSVKITRFCAFALFLIIIFVFQTVFAHDIEIFGIAPMLLIPAAISVGIFGGHQAGMVFGLILGLACDATVGNLFGYYALLLMIIGLLSGFLVEYIAWRRFLVVLLTLFLCYIIMFVLTATWKLLILGTTKGILVVLFTLTLEFIYSAILAIPCYYACKYIYKRYYNEDD